MVERFFAAAKVVHTRNSDILLLLGSNKILGFKTLHRNEGRRAILDTVISRFAATPRYLICYGFCCGLFLTANHSLCWAFCNTYVVRTIFSCEEPCMLPRVLSKSSHFSQFHQHCYSRAEEQSHYETRNFAEKLQKDLYVSSLAYQTIVLNIRAQAKSSAQFQQRLHFVRDFELEWCYFHCLNRTSTCCCTNNS